MLVQQYLIDILAGLIQIVHGGAPKDLPHRHACCGALDKWIDSAHPVMLVEALTSLLTVRERPKWLSRACSGLLSRVTLRPGGVQAVLSLMLDQEKAHAPVTAHAVKLLCSIPKQCGDRQYIQAMAPQLTALLQAARHNIRPEVCQSVQCCA